MTLQARADPRPEGLAASLRTPASLAHGHPYPPLDLAGLDAAGLPPQLLHAGLS